MGNRDYGSDPNATDILGLPSITVGPVGSSANFTNADLSVAFAAAQAAHPTGGTFNILGGTYPSTAAEVVVTSPNSTIFIDPKAVLTPAVGSSWLGNVVSGGASVWMVAWLIAAPDCVIYGGPLVDWTNITGVNTVGVMVVGTAAQAETTRVLVYGTKTTGAGTFARWVNGFFTTSKGVTYNGLCSDVLWDGSKSINCGNTVAPDGGGMKCSPSSTILGTSTQAAIQSVMDANAYDIGVKFTGDDITSGQAVGHTMDSIQISNGTRSAFAGTPAGSNGVFIEQGISGVTTNVKVTNVTAIGFATGFNMGQNLATTTACTATLCTTGFSTGFGAAVQGTVVGHKYVGCWADRCVTGYKITTSAAATGGSIVDLTFTDCTADDGGAQVTTACVVITATAANPVVGLRFVHCDFSRFASGGVAVNFGSTLGSALPGLTFLDCPGVTDQGALTNPFEVVTVFETRNQGNKAVPTSGQFNTYQIRTPFTNISVSGGTASYTALSQWGNPLAGYSAAGTSATPVASTDYCLSAADTITVTVGTAVGLAIQVIGPNGAVLAKASVTTTLTALAVPAGSTINFGAFTVGTPVVTSGLSATPFQAVITAVSSFAATQFPYNSTLQFISNNGAETFVYKSNGAAVTNPFLAYRPISLTGAGAAPVANINYEFQMCRMKTAMTAGAGIAFADQLGTALGPATLTDVSVPTTCEPGIRVSVTTAPTTTVVSRVG